MDDALLKYRAFVRVVERGSFTKAAEELYRTQSSVSKMIADLENDWDMTLLERGKSGVRLTGAGEQLLPYVRRILRGGEELTAQIGRMKGLEVGTVRIGTFASAAIGWLPNIFTRMQADLPGIDYEMLLGDHDEAERWIDEGRVDCGFLRLPTQRSFDTLLPVGHPLTKNESIAVRQPEGEPFLLLEHGGRTEVTDLLERHGVWPDIRFTTWEDHAIMAMAERGLGIGILPRPILCRIPYQIEIRPLAEPYYRQIGLAMKDRTHLSPAAKRFLDDLPFRQAEW